MPIVFSAQLKRVLLAGALTGVCAVALFGTMHAFIIVPIWTRLFRGLPFAIIGGTLVAWAFVELLQTDALRWSRGLIFGALVWVALLPSTALGALLRVTGWRTTLGTAEDVLEVILTLLLGAAIGWWRTRRLRGAIACAVALTALFLAMGGPIPVTNGRRPLLLWLGFLPLYTIAGVVLIAILRLLSPLFVVGPPRDRSA